MMTALPFTGVITVQESIAGFKEELVGRGAAFGDYDNDGDIDVYVVNLHDYGVLLRNDHGNDNKWIKLDLVGTKSNRDGIGARIRISAGGKSQIAQKKSACGYLSQSDPRIHFGLGQESIVEKIEIIWPSGEVQILENVEANKVLKITEGEDAV